MPKFCAHLKFLFQDLPLEQRFVAARDCGFEGLEFPTPYVLGVQRFADLAHANRLAVVVFAPPNPQDGAGRKGFACLPGYEADFRDSVARGLQAARILGCDRLHVMAGIMPDGATREELRATYLANMRWALERFEQAEMIMMIEPIGDESVPGYFMNHPDFALEMLDELGSPQAMLIYDLYHAHVKGLDVVAFLERHLPRIAHVHVADNPGRHEPGTGTIDFETVFRVLDEHRYDGWVGLGYRPFADTRSGLGWMKRFGHRMAAGASA